jgi:rfaE bifunctional protein nucleotidyltransferase chain/domain
VKTKNKIIRLESLKMEIPRLRKQGKKISFTNGCFDIIHYGHVSYLEAAKKHNRILIVGLNSDVSVRKIKGSKRPIVLQAQRAAILAALKCVDFVTIFNEETPLEVIKTLKPDILIKGSDWKGKKIVGHDIVQGYGGKVEYVKYRPSFSTTKIIQTIIRKCV